MQGLPTVPVAGKHGQVNPGVLRVPQQAFVDWAFQQARGNSGAAFLHTLSVRYMLVLGTATTAVISAYVVPKIMQHA